MNSKTIIKHVERLGLEAVTSVNGIPSFFLFVEIDTKDKSVLQSLIPFLFGMKEHFFFSSLVGVTNKKFILFPSPHTL